MSEKRGGPSSGRTKSKPKRSPVRSTSGKWWPYAIAGGVVVLVAAFVAVTQLGHAGSGGDGGASGGLAWGPPVATDSGPSSQESTVSLSRWSALQVGWTWARWTAIRSLWSTPLGE